MTAPATSVHRVVVVPHTHWDREWYQPFSVFQARLVETVDAVLELLQTRDDYPHFTLDGQAVVLEDYLAVRPEREAELRALVEAGRLHIGPWYSLADEFLAGPEALVRNLLIGRRVCERFGAPMRVAYTPDSFGHISQLPRLAAGFGLDAIVFERGVGDEGERLRGEFWWSSADGRHRVLAVHLLGTYSGAAGLGQPDWDAPGEADPELALRHARKVLDGGQDPVGLPEWLDASFDRVPGGIRAWATTRHLLLLNGSDHLPPQAELPELLAGLEPELDGVRLEIGHLRQFIDGLYEDGDPEAWEHHRGEFRGSRYQHILSGVLSARMVLKQANARAEAALESHAEPAAALAWLGGAAYPGPMLTHAWKTLLQNHCHDSICGCSVDAVHDEMMPRFRAVEDLGAWVADRALAHLTDSSLGHLAGPGGPPGATVLNPHPHPWTGVLEALVPLEADAPDPVGVAGPDGRPLPAEVEILRRPPPGRTAPLRRWARLRWRAELPPLGVTGVRPAASAGPDAGIAADGDALDNGRLRVERDGAGLRLEPEGGPAVRVEVSLEDVGDAGDEYDWSPVPDDAPLRWTLDWRRAEPLPPSRLRAGWRLETELELPERLADDRRRRVGRVRLPVAVELRLAAGAERLELAIELDNRAEDHRLRLVVDTDVAAATVAADGHFDVPERPLERPAGEGWFQLPPATHPQRRFAAVEADGRGLALLNRGLPELAPEAGPDGTRLAVTLLRCVGWLSRDDLVARPQGAGPALPTPGAQCPGPHRFELALLPYAGGWDEAGVPREADAFAVPPLLRVGPAVPNERSFARLPAGLRLAALKKAEDRDELVLRLWNPGRRAVEGALRLDRPARGVRVLELDESIQRELPAGAEVPLALAPKEVLTLGLAFARDAAPGDGPEDGGGAMP